MAAIVYTFLLPVGQAGGGWWADGACSQGRTHAACGFSYEDNL